MPSTTSGLARVVTSPMSVKLETAAMTRRMILPERVVLPRLTAARVKGGTGFGKVQSDRASKGPMGRAGHGGIRAMRARPETDGGPGAAADGFAGLYERFFPDVHRYIAGRLGRDVADDIAADTFVIALRKHGSFDVTRGPARAWLFGIATN